MSATESRRASSSHASQMVAESPAPSSTRQRPASPTLQPAAGQQTPLNVANIPSSRPAAAPESSPDSSPTQTDSTQDTTSSPQRIKVRDLRHIQIMADNEMHPFAEDGNKVGDQGPQYEISGMPIENIIEMVAGLLTKITATNDRQHQHLHHQMTPPEGGSSSNRMQSNSVLAFHGKNVPSITILSYLLRINKYCPTSYEVFLSLLVYFDRMMEKVNAGAMQNLREMDRHERAVASEQELKSPTSTQFMEGVAPASHGYAQTATPPLSGELETQNQGAVPGTPHSKARQPDSPAASALDADTLDLSHLFVVDSFNIHRLVIAGVTCASKFFSDIFYTNSRYAKVGGLPLPELNHLELQFLLLNDFRLSVPVEEIEAYGTTLVEFYAREVLAQRAEQDE
ncbi:cyclin-domain-containing protein [Aureobasidium sp. EXF-10727]|nr:cyclin-domain-containing protein [Aureobasidium sp. EXF-10727]KAI4726647.1 cyclin-domain-containing protein [Aureobasidium sp. EXF-10728]